MIIDFHTHIFEQSVVDDKSNFLDDKIFSILYSGDKSKLIGHNDLLKEMDNSKIDYAVAMGFPWENDKYCEKQNIYFTKP